MIATIIEVVLYIGGGLAIGLLGCVLLAVAMSDPVVTKRKQDRDSW